MYNTIQDLISAYQATPETLQTLLRDHSPVQFAPVASEDGEWSVVEVVCHLRDSEEASLARTRAMRDQLNPKLAVRDQAQLAIERDYASTSLSAALSDFLRFRGIHLQELRALSEEQWECVGEHASVGQITIKEMIAHLVAHDAIHLAQISRQLG